MARVACSIKPKDAPGRGRGRGRARQWPRGLGEQRGAAHPVQYCREREEWEHPGLVDAWYLPAEHDVQLHALFTAVPRSVQFWHEAT